jgi:formylglycine-generating enzyme required for sulfatase activity
MRLGYAWVVVLGCAMGCWSLKSAGDLPDGGARDVPTTDNTDRHDAPADVGKESDSGATDRPDAPDRPASDANCTPQCAGRTCGDDRCGGQCGMCATGQMCVDGICACGITGQILCAGSGCTNTATDPANCGMCGRACAADQMCSQGTCQLSCGAGRTNCNGACLTLGMTCSVGAGACRRSGTTFCGTGTTPACSATAGTAVTEVCNGVDDDCDGLTDEGFCLIAGACYTNGQSNPANACQQCVVPGMTVNGSTVWSDAPGGTSCTNPVNGVCTGPACGCAAGQTNCGGTCRDLQSDPADCGMCGRACTAGQMCSQGMCQLSCGAGQTNCNGACLTLGMPCSVGAGACLRSGTTVCGTGMTAACSATAGPPATEVCNGVDDDCDGRTDEGFCRISTVCYTNGQTNPANPCQRCTVASATVSGPTAWSDAPSGTSCTNPVNGACLGASCLCRPGQTNCSGTCRDLQSDPANCSMCGRACTAGQSCVAGTCTSSTGMCPTGMARIPAGSFVMGAPSDEPGSTSDERPQRTVTLSAYCLGVTEVTVADYRRCVTEGSCSSPRTGGTCNWNVSGREAHPINCIDWTQAGAVCAFLYPGRGRLPTEAEWENAASVGGTHRYPWGDTTPTNQLCWLGGNPSLNSTCAVGSFPSGNTPSGIQDLSGNVLEWVSDRFGTYPSNNDANPTGPTSGSYRVLRGGGWVFDDPAVVRARYRRLNGPTDWDVYLGVRCASGSP